MNPGNFLDIAVKLFLGFIAFISSTYACLELGQFFSRHLSLLSPYVLAWLLYTLILFVSFQGLIIVALYQWAESQKKTKDGQANAN